MYEIALTFWFASACLFSTFAVVGGLVDSLLRPGRPVDGASSRVSRPRLPGLAPTLAANLPTEVA